MFSDEINQEKNHDKKQPFKKFEKPVIPKAAEINNSSTVPMNQGNPWRNGPENKSGDVRRGPMVCFTCNQPGYKSADCLSKGTGVNNHGNAGPHTGNYSNIECYNCGKEDISRFNANPDRIIGTIIQQHVRLMMIMRML